MCYEARAVSVILVMGQVQCEFYLLRSKVDVRFWLSCGTSGVRPICYVPRWVCVLRFMWQAGGEPICHVASLGVSRFFTSFYVWVMFATWHVRCDPM